MAFFDDLGAKLSKTGQKTMQKANDLADITKLNMRTGELNNAIQELYAKVGEQYYALHREQPEEALASLCGEIDAANQELEQIRADVQRIPTVTPMERAVPAIMLIAASTLAALRSGSFCSAIART